MFDVRRRYRAVITYKLKKMQFYVYQKWIEYNSICYFQNISFKLNRKKRLDKPFNFVYYDFNQLCQNSAKNT